MRYVSSTERAVPQQEDDIEKSRYLVYSLRLHQSSIKHTGNSNDDGASGGLTIDRIDLLLTLILRRSSSYDTK